MDLSWEDYNTFTPCAYQVSTTGIYGVLFTASEVFNATDPGSTTCSPTGAIANFSTSGCTVAAWDVTVRSSATSTTDLNGRVFTYAWNGFTIAGGLLYTTLYYVTNDGYRYRQTQQGLNPAGFVFYANASGFLDSGQPLYKDLRGTDWSVSTFMPSGTGATLATQEPQYPIFFSDITVAATEIELERVLAELGIPATPPVPQLTGVSFTGNQGNTTTTVGAGGTFSFTTTDTISYQIVISRDGANFDPANTSNRVLTGLASTGSYSVYWNGKDNSGSNFPAGNNYSFKVTGRNGEVHFPIIDTEGNRNGWPTVVKLNGDKSPTVYYDDRGYVTSNGVAVGALNENICAGVTGTNKNPDHPSSAVNFISYCFC